MVSQSNPIDNALRAINDIPVAKLYGRLTRVSGLLLEAVGLNLRIGQRCLVDNAELGMVEAEVVGFKESTLCLMPIDQASGLYAGAKVIPIEQNSKIPVGNALLGRVIDGLGRPIDGKGEINCEHFIELHQPAINPMLRQAISEPLDVGVRAINGLLTLGQGQRMGLFAGSGVGKSVLLGMMTKQTKADIVIVGLIGERGREVKEFIDHNLGQAGSQKAIVVAAPADSSPLMRKNAALLCHRLAEYFRDQGQNVLLLMDSLTRYAQAQREIALALGEPPATKGYPPSVFSLLPQLVERAGNGQNPGNGMSAIYTVLTEGDDHMDPIADAARAILDGHIVLSRELAEAGQFPAIDIAASASRTMPLCCQPEHIDLVNYFRRLLGKYRQVQELIPLGGYQAGNDPELDLAVQQYPLLEQYVSQKMDQAVDAQQSLSELARLFNQGA
ncbi:flagellar protein export ATPase FliI [Paraferrimonas sp. SM1919]|uniref:flagellar protein export ATPase FliI n=1 Tax=Paraferrimonas sp. SM1919 TaxID=2662263 RepID=UPI0013D5D2ED|nr:flagellar protein export ATPase FliI [Paraferrimonas sp. SM1919]